MNVVVGLVVGVLVVLLVRLVLTNRMLDAWARQEPVIDPEALTAPVAIEPMITELERRGFVRATGLRPGDSRPLSQLGLADPEALRFATVAWTGEGVRPVVVVTSELSGGHAITTTSGLLFLPRPGLAQAFPGASVAHVLDRHAEAVALAADLGLATVPIPPDAVADRVLASFERTQRSLIERRRAGFAVVVEVAWRTALRRSLAGGPINDRPDALETLRSWAAEAQTAT